MIKAITFKKTNTLLGGEEITIDFTDNKNIIVGPKGGGKSTLFNLLIGFTKGFKGKHVTEALKYYNLEASYVEMDSGERISYDSLTTITKKDFESRADSWNNVIWQSDEIKSKLDNSKSLDKFKKTFTSELIIGNKSIDLVIEKIKKIYDLISHLKNNRNKRINWDLAFELDDKKSNYDPILTMNYDSFYEKKKYKDLQNQSKDISRKIREYIDTVSKIKLSHFPENNLFKNDVELKKYFDDLISKNQDIIKLMENKRSHDKKAIKLFESFDYALDTTKRTIKAEGKNKAVSKDFITSSISFFGKSAITLKELKSLFSEFMSSEVSVQFDKKEQHGIIDLVLNKNLKIDKDFMVTLLAVVLHKPPSTNDVEDWIKRQFKKDTEKEWSEDKLKKKILQEAAKHVKVLAGDREYASLSSGEKSIFGINFKLNKITNYKDILFLDQPEDNLDNKTISDNLVDKIKKFHGQTFIVTHNANIGILTGASGVVVANLAKDNPYIKGSIKKENSKESDIASYLEGGEESLTDRFNIVIKGENNENKNN
ncbi:MAG: hypothetical protein KAG14_05095 [Mycoplasmataceae bacterium]|nr:hypothetical protein [Mycoplasmataceae bacterium]